MQSATDEATAFAVLIACWHRWRDGKRTPTRDDVKLSDLGRWLAYSTLMEIQDNPFRLQYVTYGSRLRELVGLDRRQTFAHQHSAQDIAQGIMSVARESIETAAPIIKRVPRRAHTSAGDIAVLFLPLSRDDHGTVEFVLIVALPLSELTASTTR